MRKILIVLFTYILLLSGCSMPSYNNGDAVSIVCTSFPYYDFARNIAGDKAKVSLLVPPGGDIHSFDPTPMDIIKVEGCDIFIANGGESEAWADGLLEGLDKKPTNIIYMTEYIELLENSGHKDEHIWTSPVNAKVICEKIFSELSLIDEENTDYYRENLSSYIDKLTALDDAFRAAVSDGERNMLVFGDRFPFLYFTNEYGLSYYSAFSGCSELTEPTAKAVSDLTDRVKENNIPVVFYVEFSNRKICDTVCEETGAKPMLFHSVHNLTKDEFDSGADYISIMTENLSALKEALS